MPFFLKDRKTLIGIVLLLSLVAISLAVFNGKAHAADKGGPVTRAEAEQMFPVAPWTAIYGGLGVGTGALTSDFGFGLDGYQFSGRVGGDIQISRIVIGILAQYGYDHATVLGTSFDPKEALLGARAGVLLSDNVLAYGVVGETWLTVSGLNTHGLTTGGGLEVAMTRNWRVGLEYDHTTYDAIAAAREQSVTARLIFAFPVK